MTTHDTSTKGLSICGYGFEGPYTDFNVLRDAPGVYVIGDRRSDGNWYILDVGESRTVRSRVQTHDRAPCWKRHSSGVLGVAVRYTPGWSAEQRRALEQQIRRTYNPPCGEF